MSGKLLFQLPGINPCDASWQNRGGNVLAVATPDHIRLWDRSGRVLHEQVQKRAKILWDSDGQILAIIPQKSFALNVLHYSGFRQRTFEFEIKDVLCSMAWSKTSPILALGTQKGSLIMVNFKTDQKLPVLGKHSKKISVCAWSQDNLLALGSVDGTISINDNNGDAKYSQRLRSEPGDLQFGTMKGENKSHGSDTVSSLLDQKSIFLWKYSTDEQSELTFQAKYGKIVDYSWYGDGYIAISFMTGRVIGVSTHMAEIGTEIFNVQDHSEFCASMKLTNDLQKLATAGEDSIRIHSTNNLKVVDSIIPIADETAGGFRNLAWSDNGALLAALSNSGTLYVYLTELSVVGQSCGNRLGYLTSLSEVTVFEVGVKQTRKISMDLEPTFVGVGPYHLAAGMNNKAVFHSLEEDWKCTQEYVSSVRKISLGDNYAVATLSDGRLYVHIIEQDEVLQNERESKMLPDAKNAQDGTIISADIRGEMLIYTTSGGKIRYFLLDEWTEVNCFEHSAAIKSAFPDQSGIRIFIVDIHSKGFIYSAVDDSLLEVPELPPNVSGCLWDAEDGHILCVWDNHNQIHTYSIHHQHIDGENVELVAKGRKPKGQSALMLSGGFLYLQTNSGKLNRITLPSHRFLTSNGEPSTEDLENCVALRKWPMAHKICNEIDSLESWNMAAIGALRSLDVDAAVRFYQKVQNAGMVLSLADLIKEEDSNFVRGSCAMLLKNFDLAQSAFLSSNNPQAALDMRRDLQHWEEALQLAARLAPERVPEIAREYAGQQEFEGNFSGALSNYERCIQDGAHILSRDALQLASGGVARMSIRMGDLRRGIQLATNSPNKILKLECGEILEKMKQYSQAGKLYAKGEFWERAAAAFLKAKEWNRVGEVIDKVDTVRIHQAYAKARENEGSIEDALKAYARAGDHEAQIKLLLSKNRPAEAETIVKEASSTEGANLVARYYIKRGDYGSGIEFLVFSHCNTEAFQLAQKHGQMETYANIIEESGTKEDYFSIATHFENESNWLKAGKFFLSSGHYDRALRHFLQCHVDDSGENIVLAIECVGKAKDDKLSRLLLDYLLGHHDDGQSKHATFLFQFYVSLEQYSEAASTAVIIARDQQVKGEYKKARKFLFSMYKDLRERNIKIPVEMSSSLLLLHSYLLVRSTISARSDHETAARLLCRVAKSISKFPNHIVQLLTKTVIECNKVGLKKSAFEYSALLMRPEYRDEVDSKYRRAIEKLVRERRGADEPDAPNDVTPCPFCEKDFDSYELTCPHCRSTSPFCIATGRHVYRSSLTRCPHCNFAALLEPLLELLAVEESCPLCQESLTSSDLTVVSEPSEYLSSIA